MHSNHKDPETFQYNFLDAQKITGDGNFSVLSQYKKYTKVIGDIIK